jgi:phenylalanyl-tRNA synthetase beta chain
MLISKKWLQEFVSFPDGMSDQELANVITLSTVEVESIEDQVVAMENMVVGLITEVSQHPNADRLKLCQVDVGGRVTQIVCGGANVAQGMKVAVALPGSKVRWHGEGELIELKKAKLRGESSEGMICASSEIGLDNPDEGEHDILDLGDIDAKAGTPLSSALGMDDVIFDIEHKSLTNRPDLMGHYGMAREVAALNRSEFAPYQPDEIEVGEGVPLSVDVKDSALCPRYMAVALDGVEVGASPEWLQSRLRAAGVGVINNVVDVTNYVMLEVGQPMHAFDFDVLGGNKVKIGVRTAKKGEEITCLDGVTYKLDPEMLLITDGKKPMAIAGVMGGENSGVSESTTRIVFESANFSPVSVRKTSTKLGLRSESSARFEKSLDPRLCEVALQRAVALMKELNPQARVSSVVLDEKDSLPEPITLSLSADLVNTRLGSEISVSEMEDILTRLGFGVSAENDVLSVVVPSYRATKDVEIVEDVIEEIARIYGYDNIQSVLPEFTITPPVVDRVRVLTRAARTALAVGAGATEVYQYAFIGPGTIEVLGGKLDDHLKLANPLASDRPYLVRSLIPNLLEVVVGNQRQFETVRVFQAERVFRKDLEGAEMGDSKKLLPGQPHMLAAAFTQKGNEEPFWEAKTMAVKVLTSLGFVPEFAPSNGSVGWQHATRQADVLVGGVVVGLVSEVDPEKAENFGLDNRTAVLEIDLDQLAAQPEPEVIYAPVSVHPASARDLAFVVSERVLFGEIESRILGSSELLQEVSLFDVYRGKGVDDGHKSLALSLTFRSDERTLEAAEVDSQMDVIRSVLEKDFSAIMRS